MEGIQVWCRAFLAILGCRRDAFPLLDHASCSGSFGHLTGFAGIPVRVVARFDLELELEDLVLLIEQGGCWLMKQVNLYSSRRRQCESGFVIHCLH